MLFDIDLSIKGMRKCTFCIEKFYVPSYYFVEEIATPPKNVIFLFISRAVGTAAAMAAALFGLSVFLFTENPLKCFIL